MEWITTNWIWILVFFAFIAMHIFGHGGHGHHGSNEVDRGVAPDNPQVDKGAQRPAANADSGGHRH